MRELSISHMLSVTHLAGAQAGGVGGHKRDEGPKASNCLEVASDLLRAQPEAFWEHASTRIA
jgi:hypothetical protein